MCVHPSIHHAISSYITERNLIKFATSWSPSICPYLLLNQWAQFNRTCYMTYPYVKRVREQNYFPSVHPASVHLSVISSLTTGCTFTKLATWLPLMVRVCGVKSFFHPFVLVHSLQCLSVRHTIWILLNHWAEFNQTCYMNFPHCKGVQEQYFSVQRSSVWCPYICPSHYFLPKQWAEFNQTCNYWISLPFMVRVCESESIHLSFVHPSCC